MSSISSALLTTDILTQNMPLSDSFNKAISASTRQGVHHGFALEFKQTVAADWPMKSLSTRYLRIKAGTLEVAANQIQKYAFKDDVLCVVTLTADLDIDLEGISPAVYDSDAYDYYAVLRVTYSPSAVNNNTGLVSSLGELAATVEITKLDDSPGRPDSYGLVLGLFSRANKHIESVANNVMEAPAIWSSVAVAPNSFKDMTTGALTEFRRAVNIDNYTNLKKHVRLDGINNLNINSTLALSTIPIDGLIATTVGQINNWARPVNWYTETAESIYVTKGIWKDVEQFELTNSYFGSDVALCFHRTPGHSKIQTLYNAAPTSIAVAATIRAIPDYGSRSLTLDFKGTTFEKNLSIDLVLDFTGPTQNCLYHIYIKNLTVKGNLQVHYGQAYLALTGGAQGVIEYENVMVYGMGILRPWPQCSNVNSSNAVSNAAYPEYTLPAYFQNNAGNVSFTGYSTSGPDTLLHWGKYASSPVNTNGVLLLAYHHNATAGTGALAMANPWLKEAVDGALIFKNAVLPDWDMLAAPQHAAKIRIAVKNAFFWKDRGSVDGADYGLIDLPVLQKAGDGVITLQDFNDETIAKTLSLCRITVDSTVILGEDLYLTGDLFIDTGTLYVTAGEVSALAGTLRGRKLVTGLDAEVGTSLAVGTSATVGTTLEVGTDLSVLRDAITTRYDKSALNPTGLDTTVFTAKTTTKRTLMLAGSVPYQGALLGYMFKVATLGLTGTQSILVKATLISNYSNDDKWFVNGILGPRSGMTTPDKGLCIQFTQHALGAGLAPNEQGNRNFGIDSGLGAGGISLIPWTTLQGSLSRDYIILDKNGDLWCRLSEFHVGLDSFTPRPVKLWFEVNNLYDV